MEDRRISIILSASVHLQNTPAIPVIGGARILRRARTAPFLERFKSQSIGDVCAHLRCNCNYESAKHRASPYFSDLSGAVHWLWRGSSSRWQESHGNPHHHRRDYFVLANRGISCNPTKLSRLLQRSRRRTESRLQALGRQLG